MSDRKIIEYPHSLRTTQKKLGVRRWPATKKRQQRNVLVLGSGRSGTLFTTHALRYAGLDVRHELTAADGVVSNFFLVDSDWYPRIVNNTQGKAHLGERLDDYVFSNIVLITRDPLKTIPSIVKIFSSLAWAFYEENGVVPAGLSGLHRAMVYWTEYNERAMEIADRWFMLEEYEKAWPGLMDMLLGPGSIPPYPAHLRPMHKSSGNRKAEPVTWAQLEAVDAAAARKAKALAKRMGYRT